MGAMKKLFDLISEITLDDINHPLLHKKHTAANLKKMMTCKICNRGI
jgi:hypothetical protein